MGGPSAEAKANENAQTAFYNATIAQQQETFGQQQQVLDQIKAVTEPILSKGPNQFGFTPEEDALLRSSITDQGAKATADTINAQKLSDIQKTGGTNILPTGASAQEEETARILGSQVTATNLSNEKLAGYQAGNQLYTQALGALSGTAQLQNPTAYTGAATGAGSSATGAVELADSERSNLISSILGGVVQGGLGLATSGATKALHL